LPQTLGRAAVSGQAGETLVEIGAAQRQVFGHARQDRARRVGQSQHPPSGLREALALDPTHRGRRQGGEIEALLKPFGVRRGGAAA
jgi:hypothetical protein